MADPTTPTPVREEEEHLARVQRAIRANPAAKAREDYRATLMELRASLTDERLPEDMASIVEQMQRLGPLLARTEQQAAQVADPLNPYFGHLQVLDEDENTKDIFIGKQTFIRGDVAIVDWRDAPIARVFYQQREGEDYVMTIDRREVEGEVLLRRTLTIDQGRLWRVSGEDFAWVWDGAGWSEVSGGGPRLAGGAGVAHRPEPLGVELSGLRRSARQERFDKHLPEIASLLDRDQYDLITSAEGGIIAVQGSAGSGKTTVALHRVAWLAFQEPHRFAPERSIVIVYSRALARYIAQVLPALGVHGVEVVDFEEWAGRLLQRAAPGLPTRLSDETPSSVCRFKQHAGLVPALEALAAAHPEASPARLFAESFTSRAWIGEVAARHMPGVFSEAELDAVYRWCAQLHARRDEDLDAADGDDGPALDIEDLAILLRLHQLLRGPLELRPGKALRYAHLVIDEAQDMSPLELLVLLGTVEPGAPVTLAGDLAQQLDDENDFQSWSYVFRYLGEAATQIRPLQITYRSTEPIMRVAQAVLGPLAPETPPASPRSGDPVRLFRFPGQGEAFTFLADMLQDVMRREPNASVAVLTRFDRQADAAFQALQRAGVPRLRRVLDQSFEFVPGVEVVEIHQTKGLEFDYVVILDADADTFPRNDASRRLLHVGLTRAAHLCWLLTTQEPSPLLPPELHAS